MERQFRSERNEKGSALLVVTLLAVAGIVLIGAFLKASVAKVAHVEGQIAEYSAFNAAESGLNAIIERVWSVYKEAPPVDRTRALDPLDGKYSAEDRLKIAYQQMGRSRFFAEVNRVEMHGEAFADVEFVVYGENRKAAKSLTTVVRYGRAPSKVFDHAYFINNFGWLWGSGITVNGDVRSNGNFSMRDATVNGDIYASENDRLGAEGTVEGDSRHDSIAEYWNANAMSARPTNPSAPSEDANGNGVLDPDEDANGNGSLDTYEYPGGYDGDSERFAREEQVEMPYLGDLQVYRELAAQKGGTLRQGGTTVVDGVLGDDEGESDRILLVGTQDDPIVLDGPVVVESDVVLKGYITGRGTIYAGRNVHIIGNLEYVNPPSWPKPSTDPEALKAANLESDLVGLAARGSILIGDYTDDLWKTRLEQYQTPPFTQEYPVDPADAELGYVTHHGEDGKPMFDGDYTALDGGVKDDGAGGTEARRFYESSFSDSFIAEKADSAKPTRIEAILYTNHLLSGDLGESTFNGCLVSRDEAMRFVGSITMNYDNRIRGDGYEHIDIFLPRGPAYRVLYWSEGKPAVEAEEVTQN